MSKFYKNSKENLYAIAELQDGYFTANQAKSAGFIDANHKYHLNAGNWIRVWRGIYRLTRYPQSENEQYILWYLWSMNRNQNPQGVYSHETALNIYELSDVSPSKLHMTVPLNFRRQSPIPKVLVLHKGTLKENNVIHMRGFAVTKPLKSILDLSEEGITSREHIEQAAREAYQRGIILKDEYMQAIQSGKCKPWLKELIEATINETLY